MSLERPIITPGGPAMDLSAIGGLRAELRAVVHANLRQILVDALYDRVGHAYAVASGKVHFRDAFNKAMGAFFEGNRAQSDYLSDVAFQFLETQWRLKYPGQSATAFLDQVHIESPLSAREEEEQIEDAWEVTIGSSDRAMDRHYVGGQRVRKGRDAFSTFWNRTPEEIAKKDKG